MKHFEAAYGSRITKADILFYVYGLLHFPEYRETYAAALKKMLPRVPLVEDPWPFVEAGRRLSELHLGYEDVSPYPLDGLDVEPTGDPYAFLRGRRWRSRRCVIRRRGNSLPIGRLSSTTPTSR